jgi:predicted RNA binding protein YcfA (HicA-like mRNA interferase family)
MRSHPNSIDFVTVDYVLLHLGFEKREGKGSHVIYFKQETGETITIPKRKPIKTCYIQLILSQSMRLYKPSFSSRN